jgi:hypothetical protein
VENQEFRGLKQEITAVKFDIHIKKSLCPEETAQDTRKNSPEHGLFPF